MPSVASSGRAQGMGFNGSGCPTARRPDCELSPSHGWLLVYVYQGRKETDHVSAGGVPRERPQTSEREQRLVTRPFPKRNDQETTGGPADDSSNFWRRSWRRRRHHCRRTFPDWVPMRQLWADVQQAVSNHTVENEESKVSRAFVLLATV